MMLVGKIAFNILSGRKGASHDRGRDTLWLGSRSRSFCSTGHISPCFYFFFFSFVFCPQLLILPPPSRLEQLHEALEA